MRPGHFRGVLTVVHKLLVADRRRPRRVRGEGLPAARARPADGRATSTCRWRSTASRRCASPTGWRCPAATATSSDAERAAGRGASRARSCGAEQRSRGGRRTARDVLAAARRVPRRGAGLARATTSVVTDPARSVPDARTQAVPRGCWSRCASAASGSSTTPASSCGRRVMTLVAAAPAASRRRRAGPPRPTSSSSGSGVAGLTDRAARARRRLPRAARDQGAGRRGVDPLGPGRHRRGARPRTTPRREHVHDTLVGGRGPVRRGGGARRS